MRILLALMVLTMGATAHAASLRINGDGHVEGVDGIVIGTATYDATFVDGTCVEIFSGCDEISDFQLGEADALTAATQITDAFTGSAYQHEPDEIVGCTDTPSICRIAIPWDPSSPATSPNLVTVALTVIQDDPTLPVTIGVFYEYEMTNAEVGTFVVLTEVPLPASAWLFVSALVGLLGIGRRRTA